jgi:hypothetical protein
VLIGHMIFAPILLECVMSETLERMQERAREFARSGRFASWRAVVFELQFEQSLQEALRRKYLYWLNDASEDANTIDSLAALSIIAGSDLAP